MLPGDPYGLDADHDGIACEDLPCPCSSIPPTVTPPPVVTPPTVVAPPVQPVVEPVAEDPAPVEPVYRAYVACSHSPHAAPARRCPQGSHVGAFFESSVETADTVCVRFPASRSLCSSEQRAEAEVLFVNAITTRELGRHVVIWHVGGRRIVRHFALTR